MEPKAPIFIHAWWRSASTYLWSKLRADPALRCYYEPLNERIAGLAGPVIGGVGARHAAQMRHPPAERHYFSEYSALLAAGTLGYTRDLAYARYLLDPASPDDRLESYLQRLVADAAGAGLRPVLCFCRSQMRSAWMRHHFEAVHVAQLRNPDSQFRSFSAAPYFEARLLNIAVRLCSRLPEAFAHMPHLRDLASGPVQAGQRIQVPAAESRAAFALIWTASALQAVSAADCVLDVDLLTTDASRRAAAVGWFLRQGCALDLGDCQVPDAASAMRADGALEAELRAATDALKSHARGLAVFDPERVSARLGELSPACRAPLERVLA